MWCMESFLPARRTTHTKQTEEVDDQLSAIHPEMVSDGGSFLHVPLAHLCKPATVFQERRLALQNVCFLLDSRWDSIRAVCPLHVPSEQF